MAELYSVLNGIRSAINDENETETMMRNVGSSLYPVSYQVPVAVESTYFTTVDIGEPQDKLYSGEAEEAFEMSLSEAKTGVAIHTVFENIGGPVPVSNLYPSLFPSNMTSPIAEILSVSFRELKDGMYQEEVEIPPNYIETNSDGTQRGSYTASDGRYTTSNEEVIYAYDAGNYNFIAYKLGIYTVYYN
jgi:hypothetical protein